VNGNRASTDDVRLWWPDQPGTSGENLDCANGFFSDNSDIQFLAYDERCSAPYRSICEKLI